MYQPDIVLKKKPRIYMVSDMLEHQQQNMLFSTQESLKRQSSTSVPFPTRAEGRGKGCRSWTSKDSCSKGGTGSFDEGQRTSNKRGTTPEREGKVHLDKEVVFRGINYNGVNCSHDRECDCGHPPHCKYFKKDKCQMRKDGSFIHSQKKRSDLPVLNEKKKEHQKSSKKEGYRLQL